MVSRSKSNIRLVEAIDAYEIRIRNEGQADATRKTVHYALERFRKSVTKGRDVNPWLHSITPAQADDYCFGPEGLRVGGSGGYGKPIGSFTFNRYRSALKVFFDYALMQRWVDVNPFDGIGAARPDAPKKRLMLNATELLSLLDHCTNPVQRVACSLGMNTGLRANDIRHLTVFDASLAGGTIQTEIRKTRKFDVKPITMELHHELERWLNLYAQFMGLKDRGELPNDWLLVPSYRNAAPREKKRHIHPRPLQIQTHPWRMVQNPLGRMGYPTKGEGFHTLRRSSARALFETLRDSGEGRDHALMIVKDFLNHASVTQTEHYLGLNQERVIRDAVLKDRPFLTALAEHEQSRVDSPVTPLLERRAT